MTTPNDTTLYYVYRIVNSSTGNVYVGQTYNPKVRARQHFSELKSNTHDNPYLQHAFNKYGRHTFYFEVLEKDISRTDIDEREIYWINYFDSYHNGYNNAPGGRGRRDDGIPCTWNGIDYTNKAMAARANNIDPTSMSNRLERGYTCDADLFYRPCTWNGINYVRVSDAARANRVNPSTMFERLENGYVCDTDISTHNRNKPVIWDGIEYLSISHAARAIGIERTVMQGRLKRGRTCDNDLNKSRLGKSCTWNGISYKSVSEAAKANGVLPSVMSKRMVRGLVCDADMIRKRKQGA